MRLLNAAFGKTGSRELAEDLVQDVFMQLYLNKDINSSIEGYLFTSLRNKIISSWRKSVTRDKYIASLVAAVNGKTPDVFSAAEAKELDTNIHKEIEKLPPQCRSVFVLSREYLLSNKEIAEQLGISVNTVEQHMRKALRILRTHIPDYMLRGIWLGVLHQVIANNS